MEGDEVKWKLQLEQFTVDGAFYDAFVEGYPENPMYYRSRIERKDMDSFDSLWFEDMYHPKHNSEVLPKSEDSKYSIDTSPSSGVSSLMSYDHGDRACYEVQSMRRHASKEGNVADSVSPNDAAQDPTTPMRPPYSVKTSRPVMYSPMKRYPKKLLNPFLEWYSDAKKKK